MIKYIKDLLDKRYIRKSIIRNLTGFLVLMNYLKHKRGVVSFYVYVRPMSEIERVYIALRESIKDSKNAPVYPIALDENRAIFYIEANKDTRKVPSVLGKEDAFLMPEIIDSKSYRLPSAKVHVTIKS